ncbi:MAG: UDP-4-amino-4,6-dideoxy-N-acetyl-beta-L-altrosamine transaminase [Thermoanaerobaculia bacterium]
MTANGTAKPKPLPYGRQSISEDDIAAVSDVLRSDWLTTGPKVGEFEAAFAEAVGAKHAVAVSNGTAALHAAAYAAGVGEGDEAIVPPMTFAASANCIRYQGGTVVFADVRGDTLCLDAREVEKALTARTRAIVTVDYAGQPSDLDELMKLAEGRGCVVIEDAAHAIGATYKGRPVGSIAHLTTFSLHPVKQITTGEGGVVTTNDGELARKLRLFRNHGITTDHREREKQGSWYYEMVDLGFNYRLTDFQCALGISQLLRLPEWIGRRRAIAARYAAAFADLRQLSLPAILSDRQSAWHLYVVELNPDKLRATRAEIFQELRSRELFVNVHYIPVHLHPYYRQLGYYPGSFPVAEAAYERLITLPLFPGMSDDDVDRVIAVVREVCAEHAR